MFTLEPKWLPSIKKSLTQESLYNFSELCSLVSSLPSSSDCNEVTEKSIAFSIFTSFSQSQEANKEQQQQQQHPQHYGIFESCQQQSYQLMQIFLEKLYLPALESYLIVQINVQFVEQIVTCHYLLVGEQVRLLQTFKITDFTIVISLVQYLLTIYSVSTYVSAMMKVSRKFSASNLDSCSILEVGTAFSGIAKFVLDIGHVFYALEGFYPRNSLFERRSSTLDIVNDKNSTTFRSVCYVQSVYAKKGNIRDFVYQLLAFYKRVY